MLAVGIGFAVAREWSLALGPTIAGTASALFAVSMLKRKT
jgi:hypothetical protein